MKEVIDLNIKGMNCSACVGRIEKGLLKENGILKVQINLATEKAKVEIEEKTISPATLIQLIKKIGYEASIQNSKGKGLQADDLKPELIKLVVCSLLTIPLLIPMFFMGDKHHQIIPSWVQLILATPVQFYFGAKFYKGAWLSLKSKIGDMNLLVALGTTSAYGLSLYGIIYNPYQIYFESSATVITLVLMGKYLEAKAKRKTTEAISALQSFRPERVWVQKGQEFKEIALDEIQLNDILRIRPGERIPVDGKIIEGETHLDESLMTGESLPISKAINDKVIGGSLNHEGLILVQTIAIGSNTLLSKIIELLESAQYNKPKIQRLVDKISAAFVPTVLVIALLTLVLTGLFKANWELGIMNAVAVLVMACPCALGLATPTSIMVGTGVAAKAGILIRDGEALEKAQSISTIIFDKTGTLTQGRPVVAHVEVIVGETNRAISIIQSLNEGSEHPLAKAIGLELKTLPKSDLFHVVDQKTIPGLGVEGRIENKSYLYGSKRILTTLSIEDLPQAQEWQNKAETVSYLVDKDEKKIIAMISFTDELREGSKQSIAELKKNGIRVMMVTGDHQQAAQRVANLLDIDDMTAEVSPAEKLEIIKSHQLKGEVVAMVGDGINDAPALATADVGIALSTGTDIAMNSSSITLMNGDPSLISDAILISKKTYQKIKQNLFWAFIYNLLGIPLAASGKLSPMLAGAAMGLSSICVVLNALSLRSWRPKKP